MASPPEVTIKDLSGNWVMVSYLPLSSHHPTLYSSQTQAQVHQLTPPLQNKSLSDDTDAVLTLQGVGWWQRKAIGLATVYLSVKQYTDDNSISHIDIDQTATGGIKGTTENRTLDWEVRNHEDHIFGNIAGRSRWSTFQGIDDEFMKEGWLEFEEEKGGPNGEFHVENYALNEERGWDTRQIWGFAIVDGARYYVRRIVVTKGDQVLKVRLVYNFTGRHKE